MFILIYFYEDDKKNKSCLVGENFISIVVIDECEIVFHCFLLILQVTYTQGMRLFIYFCWY